MKRQLLSLLVILLPVVYMAGCGQSADKDGTAKADIEINLPDLPDDAKVLSETLAQVTQHAKREFTDSLPNTKEFPEYADRQFDMRLDFKITAESPRFISVMESGYEDTGGAHPIPVSATFVYDRQSKQMIPLTNLFKDSNRALEALSGYARKALLTNLMKKMPDDADMTADMKSDWKAVTQQTLEEGTMPTAENFANFLIQEGDDTSPGITLVFPPYQVAAYVYGTQTVDVPARVFRQLLTADYQQAFSSAE